MSSPIQTPYTSSGLYIPVHKRNRSTSSSYSSTSPSPLSSRDPSPLPSTPHHGVYTPAELLSLAHSRLAHASGGDMDARLRAVAPEVMRTRKQQKTLAWHARRAPTPATTAGRGRSSREHASESDEDKTTQWRRV